MSTSRMTEEREQGLVAGSSGHLPKADAHTKEGWRVWMLMAELVTMVALNALGLYQKFWR